MPAKPLIQARIDAETKEEATAVLKAMGLTVSDAVRMMIVRVAREKALPFEPLVPNETTVAAMREARVGDLPRFDSVEALTADLLEDNESGPSRSIVVACCKFLS